ncbi:MAG: hypothetical protein ABSD79_02980 [Dehalococcoidales bacterium]
MKKWLVVHSLESYEESPKRIGFGAKSNLDGSPKLDESGKTIPVSPKIFEMKPGDRVVYYCKGDSVIKGIYEIVKLCGEEEREKKWPDALFQFEITPIYELDEPYNFKLLVPSLKLFEGISDTKRWGAVLQITESTSEFNMKLLTGVLSKVIGYVLRPTIKMLLKASLVLFLMKCQSSIEML